MILINTCKYPTPQWLAGLSISQYSYLYKWTPVFYIPRSITTQNDLKIILLLLLLLLLLLTAIGLSAGGSGYFTRTQI